jgi:uncharacterized protein (TIGR02271 family)
MSLFGKREDHEDRRVVENEKLQLRKEELDINKGRVRTGEVKLRKDVIEEQQVVDVPVNHEEVIIERRALNERSDSPITGEGEIHIPVSREQVNVDKHTILTGEVSAHKREVEETEHVSETLKREEARVDTEGDPNIVSDETDSRFH